MPLLENDPEDSYVPTRPTPLSPAAQKRTSRHIPRQHNTTMPTPEPPAETKESPLSPKQITTPVSWPIMIAVVPALGSFFSGSAEVWGDFVVIVLILYYVYQWMTVSWTYYENARSNRVFVQHTIPDAKEDKSKADLAELKRREKMAAELRRHEIAGLLWVLLSPLVAGAGLHYSRYFLSNSERTLSSFNIVIFVLAATIKPLGHVVALLRERTLYLKNEIQVSESQVEMLQKKLDLLEQDLGLLRKALATKKDLGQVTEDLNPTLQHLAKALRQFEKKELALQAWSEERFAAIDEKVTAFDQYVYYHIEKEHEKRNAHSMIVTLILLPLNIGLWAAKSMTGLIPVPHAFLESSSTGFSLKSFHSPVAALPQSPTRSLTHSEMPADSRSPSRPSPNQQKSTGSITSGDSSIAAFGFRSRVLES